MTSCICGIWSEILVVPPKPSSRFFILTSNFPVFLPQLDWTPPYQLTSYFYVLLLHGMSRFISAFFEKKKVFNFGENSTYACVITPSARIRKFQKIDRRRGRNTVTATAVIVSQLRFVSAMGVKLDVCVFLCKKNSVGRFLCTKKRLRRALRPWRTPIITSFFYRCPWPRQ